MLRTIRGRWAARSVAPAGDAVTSGLLVGGLALTALVGADGSPGWRLARLILTGTATIGGLVASRAGGRWWVAVWCVGVLHVVAGLGIGPRHLQLAGLHWRGVIGLAELLAGLVVLAALAARVLGPRSWPRRLLGVPVPFLGVLVVCWTAVPAVMATNVPPIDADTEVPEVLGPSAVDVRFPAADGIELAAWWVPPDDGRVVIVRHGASSTRGDAVDQAAVLVAAGYGVLVTDARGHGASGGRAMDFGWWGDADLAAAAAFVAAQPGVDGTRLGVLGLSMGAEEAIGAAAAIPAIAAVVAEGATGRDAPDKTWMRDEYGVGGWVQGALDIVEFGLTDLLTAAPTPTPLADGVRNSTARLLLIAAGEVPDEQHVAERLEAVAPDRVDVWVVEGSTHTRGLDTAPEEWRTRVVAFFDAALATA